MIAISRQSLQRAKEFLLPFHALPEKIRPRVAGRPAGVLGEPNRPVEDSTREACLHELFEAQVKAKPGAQALVVGASRLTYRELNRRANRVAHHLRSLGVGPDTLVGIFLDRSADMVIALLGVLKAGGAYVPLDP